MKGCCIPRTIEKTEIFFLVSVQFLTVCIEKRNFKSGEQSERLIRSILRILARKLVAVASIQAAPFILKPDEFIFHRTISHRLFHLELLDSDLPFPSFWNFGSLKRSRWQIWKKLAFLENRIFRLKRLQRSKGTMLLVEKILNEAWWIFHRKIANERERGGEGRGSERVLIYVSSMFNATRWIKVEDSAFN